MSSTSLKLVSSNAQTGAKINTTIPYVNESASSATLKQFGQMLNSLTTNNYLQTDRVQTINVDTEEVPTGNTKPTPTITLTPSSLTRLQIFQRSTDIKVEWTGDYQGDIYTKTIEEYDPNVYIEDSGDDAGKTKMYLYHPGNQGDTGTWYSGTLTGIVMIPETANYSAATANFTVTE